MLLMGWNGMEWKPIGLFKHQEKPRSNQDSLTGNTRTNSLLGFQPHT